MCGRFTHLYTWKELHKLMELVVPRASDLGMNYNAAPSQNIPIVRYKSETEYILDSCRWGLIPAWAPDTKIGYKLINARAETIGEKPSFRAAYKERRCIVPVSGFYEWDKKGKAGQKRPFYIRGKESEVLLFAGLWEIWEKGGGSPVESFTIITTSANSLLESLHDRMPVILNPESVATWLNPKAPSKELTQLLKPYPGELMKFYEVSSKVNNARYTAADCIEAC